MDLLNISQSEYEFCNVELHQPTICELAKIFKQEEDLIFILKLLISPLQQTLSLESEELSEFQIFLGLLVTDTSSFGLTIGKKKNLLELINLCFKGYELKILKNSFIFKKLNEEDFFIVIDDNNFNEFKQILGSMFDIPEIFGKQEAKYNPKNARAARIAKALEAGNKKVAEINKSENKKGIIENYISILAIGLKIPPSILCRELTLYNLFNLYKRFTMKISWDLDIDCRLAGGSPKDSPDNWMTLT